MTLPALRDPRPLDDSHLFVEVPGHCRTCSHYTDEGNNFGDCDLTPGDVARANGSCVEFGERPPLGPDTSGPRR